MKFLEIITGRTVVSVGLRGIVAMIVDDIVDIIGIMPLEKIDMNRIAIADNNTVVASVKP